MADYSNKDVSITFRTNSELKKGIEKLAAADNRTVSNFLHDLLIKAVKASKGVK